MFIWPKLAANARAASNRPQRFIGRRAVIRLQPNVGKVGCNLNEARLIFVSRDVFNQIERDFLQVVSRIVILELPAYESDPISCLDFVVAPIRSQDFLFRRAIDEIADKSRNLGFGAGLIRYVSPRQKSYFPSGIGDLPVSPLDFRCCSTSIALASCSPST